MKAITKRQKYVLFKIIQYSLKNNRYPTYRDMAEILSMTPKGVVDHVTALTKKGFIDNDKHAGIRAKGLKIIYEVKND